MSTDPTVSVGRRHGRDATDDAEANAREANTLRQRQRRARMGAEQLAAEREANKLRQRRARAAVAAANVKHKRQRSPDADAAGQRRVRQAGQPEPSDADAAEQQPGRLPADEEQRQRLAARAAHAAAVRAAETQQQRDQRLAAAAAQSTTQHTAERAARGAAEMTLTPGASSLTSVELTLVDKLLGTNPDASRQQQAATEGPR